MEDFMNTINLLLNSKVFYGLANEDINIILPLLYSQQFEKNKTIFNENEQGNAMYFIIDGSVKIIKKIDNTRTKTLSQLKTGDCFGEMSLIDGNIRSAGAVTVRDTTLAILTKEAFDSIIKAHPEISSKILMNLAKILTNRLREADEQILDILSFHFQGNK